MALTSPPRAVESAVGASAHAARPLVPRPAQHVVPSGPQMCLALARPLADGQYETLALNPGEPIRDLNLKLTNRGWYSGKSCIVFGDRELADAVRLSDLVSASGKATPAYLHVFVKLTDVESVTMRTLMRELSLSNPVAAEQRLAATMMKAATSGTSLLALPCATTQQAEAGEGVASVGVEELPSSSASGSSSASSTPFAASGFSTGDASDTSAQDAFNSTTADCDSHSRAVVHLCIHKSAKVNWHHMSENKFELSISSSETVESLMRKIEAANGISLEPGSILIDGQPLSAGQPLAAYGINRGITKLELVPLEPEGDDAEALPDGSPSLASPAHGLHQHWKAARAGLAEGLAPTLAKAGTGGSYFLQDVSGRPVAVFKPEDEEPLAVNNPKGRTPGSSSDSSSSATGSSLSGGSKGSEGLRRGTKPGEGAVREVAAYVLDHGHFSGVPPTALVSAYVSEDTTSSSSSGTGGAVKVGSLQQFVESEGDCEERGYSGFPVSEVHKIAVLDLRLANADRNAGNILARRKPDGSGGETWELIPIDHGYCLPASFEDLSYEWMYWPQAEQPFSESTLAYIAALDADRDVATLAAHGITLRPECERVFRACTLTLQKGAAAGLTPSQIAGILCREGLTKSVIEKLHSNATQLAKAGAADAPCGRRVPQAAYLQKLGALLDEYLEDYLLECADLLY